VADHLRVEGIDRRRGGADRRAREKGGELTNQKRRTMERNPVEMWWNSMPASQWPGTLFREHIMIARIPYHSWPSLSATVPARST